MYSFSGSRGYICTYVLGKMPAGTDNIIMISGLIHSYRRSYHPLLLALGLEPPLLVLLSMVLSSWIPLPGLEPRARHPLRSERPHLLPPHPARE